MSEWGSWRESGVETSVYGDGREETLGICHGFEMKRTQHLSAGPPVSQVSFVWGVYFW